MPRLAIVTFLFLASIVSAQAQVSFQPQVRGLGCLRPQTRAMITQLTAQIGPIQITSTCGGKHAHNSQHYRGNAIDFRPQAVSSSRAVAALRGMSIVGGIGHYGSGVVHADVGERQLVWGGQSRGARMRFASPYKARGGFARVARHSHGYVRHAGLQPRYDEHAVQPDLLSAMFNSPLP
ncbi:MAG: DUF882 domain-containing protein [Verrucomicrobiaceae bacterium]|nr:MAG: DUF882 domain-containing protein [Verrucomicrobiaceae bacterium]